MEVVEVRFLKGRVTNRTEVAINENGMMIEITDDDGNQVEIHRYAWDGVVKTVERLLQEHAPVETLEQLQNG